MNIYTCKWIYETHKQDMSPQEAAELAASVLLSASDPSATAQGHVQFTVNEWDGHTEYSHGEFEVKVSPSYDKLLTYVRDIAGWRKDGEPLEAGELNEYGDSVYVLENDTAVDLHYEAVDGARTLLGIPEEQ